MKGLSADRYKNPSKTLRRPLQRPAQKPFENPSETLPGSGGSVPGNESLDHSVLLPSECFATTTTVNYYDRSVFSMAGSLGKAASFNVGLLQLNGLLLLLLHVLRLDAHDSAAPLFSDLGIVIELRLSGQDCASHKGKMLDRPDIVPPLINSRKTAEN